MERATTLKRLLDELPSGVSGDDAEEQLRATLRPLVKLALDGDRLDSPSATSDGCANCGKPPSSPRSPYCSRFCRDMAGFIRRFRLAVEQGTIFERERQVAFGESLWSLQGGGFPRRQRLVPERVKVKVLARDEGKCAVCGAPAFEVDHFGSA